jgi:conjugation system TraG family ATPase
MEKTLEKMLPILDVQQGVIVSKQGDATLAFRLELPEIFTLSDPEYEAFHQAWLKAIRVLPKHTVLYKQDWFIRTGHEPDFYHGNTSFLDRSSDRFFNERPFLDHDSYLFLTKKPSGRKAASSLFSSLARPSLIHKESLGKQELQDFRDAAGQFQRILEDSGFVRAIALEDDDIYSDNGKAGLLERYCTLSKKEGEHLFGDIVFDDALLINGKYAQLYTLGDAANLPSLCGPRITYDRYSTDRTSFSVGFASPLGQLLSCNHIYSQYIFIDDAAKTLQRMESKRLRLQSLSAYSREKPYRQGCHERFPQ